MSHADQSMIYFGDDYGGHNIPYPHPRPPQPHIKYQQDSFIDLTAVYGEGNQNSGYSQQEPQTIYVVYDTSDYN